MKFDYLVKHNGIYYPAGTDVPIEDNGGDKAPVKSSGKVDVVKEDKIKPEYISPADNPFKDDKRKYTDEELDVPYFSLKSMAKKEGLKIPDKAKASEIREMLRAL